MSCRSNSTFSPFRIVSRLLFASAIATTSGGGKAAHQSLGPGIVAQRHVHLAFPVSRGSDGKHLLDLAPSPFEDPRNDARWHQRNKC